MHKNIGKKSQRASVRSRTQSYHPVASVARVARISQEGKCLKGSVGIGEHRKNKKMEMRGIDPRAPRMLSECSTI